ncbi:OmpA family protein [Leptospira langatensis]|uniref:OmpA family protein n=1 Tax=Leptospira langatensis TaxID=2484983 RepID=A0A5F1ZUG9_9LEPT|nr:OmpA family protein [Leptospira langatensis]TGK03166.1 OmpA family protein [Leptospira langatensis]TGL41922.1 OmpA family protein [Leptospira langatensis]
MKTDISVPSLLFIFLLSGTSIFTADSISQGKVSPLKGEINTGLNEFGISLSQDGKILYYYSKRQNSNYSDLYKSVKNGDSWSKGVEIRELNSNFDDQSPYITGDEKEIIFSSNRDGSIEFQLASGRIGVSRDLYYSNFANGRWEKPMPLPPEVNTPEIEENPFLYGTFLLFTRYPFGKVAESDIYLSEFKNEAWTEAFALDKPINTEYAELAATVSRDGKYLYFSSNRPGGYGGLDIYKSEIKADGSFSSPVNLGPVVNSKGDEAFFLEAPDGKNAYFCRLANEGGNYDIYEFSAANEWESLKKNKKISLESIHFRTASYEIEDVSFPILDRLVDFLKENPNIKLKIIGHTDLHGDPKDNLELSRQRASAVREYLQKKGISESRLSTDGKGSQEPIYPEKNPETDGKNRRTEFQILD